MHKSQFTFYQTLSVAVDMGRDRAVVFIAIAVIAVVFVFKTFSLLHSKGSLVQGVRESPVDTVRIAEVMSLLAWWWHSPFEGPP